MYNFNENNVKAIYLQTETHIEIYFDSIPNEVMRESLRILGWRFIRNKKCWSNKKTVENLQLAKIICKKEGVNDYSSKYINPEWERYFFESDNFVVIRGNGFYCNLHHRLEDVAGGFWVVDKRGNIKMQWVPIAYCESCDVYYILRETYLNLKKEGVILCQMIDNALYLKDGAYDNDFEKWKDVGPLKLWGYTTSAAAGLTDIQRQRILEDIIDYGSMSKDEVLSYLDFFIRINQRRSDAGIFIDKWMVDRKHISSYWGKERRVLFMPKQ